MWHAINVHVCVWHVISVHVLHVISHQCLVCNMTCFPVKLFYKQRLFEQLLPNIVMAFKADRSGEGHTLIITLNTPCHAHRKQGVLLTGTVASVALGTTAGHG